MMKNTLLLIISLMLTFVSTITLAQSNNKFNLQAKAGPFFSGFGDVWGTDVNISFGYQKKYLGINLTGGLAQGTRKGIAIRRLQNTENLLVLDRWLDNYPSFNVPAAFDFGSVKLDPSTNFYQLRYLRLEINGEFRIGKFLKFGIQPFVGIQQHEVTYLGLITPALVDPPLGLPKEMVITAPLLLNFVEITKGFNFYFNAKIGKRFQVGPHVSWSESDIRWFSMGLNMKVSF